MKNNIIIGKAKKWGNSIGIIVPRDIIIKEQIKPNDTILIEIKKELKVKDLMEIAKKVKQKKFDTEKIMKESKDMWGMD